MLDEEQAIKRAFQEALQQGRLDGAAAERERIFGILDAAGSGQRAQALELAREPGMTVELARRLLAGMVRPNGNAFADYMSARGNPVVGVDDGGGGEDASADQIAARILAHR